jgi:nitroreductase
MDMNPVLENIKTRRSVRSYLDKPVPKELIQKVLEAGNYAPTGNNRQAWRFVVVTNDEIRGKLYNTAYANWKRFFENIRQNNPDHFEKVKHYGEMKDPVYYEAPCIIFVIGSSPLDCAMVTENMMLAAHSLGLGNCYLYFGAQITDNPELVEALELKDPEKIYGPVILGYSDVFPDPPPKKPPEVKWI